MDALGTMLRQLAMVCFGMSVGSASAMASGLVRIPDAALHDVVGESEEEDRWTAEERLQLLALLRFDPRAAVRAWVARSLAVRPLAWAAPVDQILASLADDPRATVQLAAADALAASLRATPALARTEVVASWAVEGTVGCRLALARALSGPIACVGASSALRHLAADPQEAVRDAAHRALRGRRAGL